MSKTITILEGNYNSIEEAKNFAAYCELRGYRVDYRENTSGVELCEDQEEDNKLWRDFCNG